MTIKRVALAFAVAIGGVCGSLSLASAGVNLITNGSFENGLGGAGLGGFVTLNAGDANITGWTIVGTPPGGAIDWINGYWQAADGTHSIDLNGDGSMGGVQQTINTVIGGHYMLTFDLSGNPDAFNNPGIRTLIASAGGASAPFTYAFSVPSNNHANMNWQLETLFFTATATDTLIGFQSTTPNCCYGPALDNVSVSAVPEPSTWAMMLIGFAGLGFATYRNAHRSVGAVVS